MGRSDTQSTPQSSAEESLSAGLCVAPCEPTASKTIPPASRSSGSGLGRRQALGASSYRRTQQRDGGHWRVAYGFDQQGESFLFPLHNRSVRFHGGRVWRGRHL